MFLIVLFLGLLNFLWGELVPSGGGLGWDGVLYADMVRNIGSIIRGGQLSSYYAQRFLPSIIVRGMLLCARVPINNTSIIRGFEVYNLALLLGTCRVWKRLADAVHLSLAGRWIGFSGIFVNFECSKQAFFYPVLTDVTALFIGMLLLLFFVEKKQVALFITTIVGAFSWPVVSVYGALLLLFMRTELPEDVITPASSSITINGASITRHVKRGFIALFALSIIGNIILEHIGPLPDLACNLPAFMTHIAPRFDVACTQRRELHGFGRLLTSLPSFAVILIALAMLVASRKFFYAVLVSIRRAHITLIALSIAAYLIPYFLVKAISNPHLANAGSLRDLIVGTLLPQQGKLLLPIVSLAVFWGPVLLLIILYWKTFCIEARKLGPGVVAIIGITMLLGFNGEPRFLTAAWPLIVFVFVLSFEAYHTMASFKYAFAVISVVYAQFWMKLTLAPWLPPDDEGLLNYPKQLYFMHYGLWMNWWTYSIQLITLVLSALWLYKTVSKVGSTEYERVSCRAISLPRS
jgi:hypothetical protein